MEPEGSLQYSKHLVLASIPSQMNALHSYHISLRSNLKLPHCICEGLTYGLFDGEILALKRNVFLVRPCKPHGASHYAVFSSLLILPPHQVHSTHSLVFLPCDRASFTPIQNNSQHFNFLCVNLYVVTGRQDSELNGGSHSLNIICP